MGGACLGAYSTPNLAQLSREIDGYQLIPPMFCLLPRTTQAAMHAVPTEKRGPRRVEGGVGTLRSIVV